jgi:two-component system, NarL family, nitrate/nitrite response regulator NarL
MVATLNAITVLLVDDHHLVRRGIRSVLETHDDIKVVGEASNGMEAVQYARSLNPQVIIMDIKMPYMDGVQATRLIKQEHPHTKIIGLSMLETATMREALLRAGAVGYLNKDDAGDNLYQIIIQYFQGS